MSSLINTTSLQQLSGIVKRVTFHSSETGWSVLRFTPFGNHEEVTVTVHQSKVFAGATVDFYGEWVNHPTYGRQFKAVRVEERKPATTHALEKYLGSGLIKGVGPVTAKKIVRHFGKDTLDVFDTRMDRLTEVPGIAKGKLKMISHAWKQHQEIREVMMFLQSHGISTLFAVKIYKTYGQQAIEIVQKNPYRLSQDIYGIGFFSADKVALQLGLAADSSARVTAGIGHILQTAREEGHCYLTLAQIESQVTDLLSLKNSKPILSELIRMEKEEELKTRKLSDAEGQLQTCYYALSLFHDENFIARKTKSFIASPVTTEPLNKLVIWLSAYCEKNKLQLSEEQRESVLLIAQKRFSLLTGKPGCGKTTTTRALVAMLKANHQDILLAAPTGRAAQRMGEVIGMEAQTIHRLLEWDVAHGGFKRKESYPLECDFLIVDESSMLDVHLAAAIFRAMPDNAQLLLIGDPDQLPSVGAGNVFKDLLTSEVVPVARLTKVFRQAQESKIIQYAHQINQGQLPSIDSPFHQPVLWKNKEDCLFIDSVEATQEQIRFISKVKRSLGKEKANDQMVEEPLISLDTYQSGQDLVIPDKFSHVDVDQLVASDSHTEELKSVLRKVHPWSSLHWGYSALEMVVKLYQDIIPKYYGQEAEIQILSPMSKGSLGTHKLNEVIQQSVNPPSQGKSQMQFGGKVFREGDRVIQRRNNYDLNVFNGDIGRIVQIDNEEMSSEVAFTSGDQEKTVLYEREHLQELDLAYAITIHKSQGSEFGIVILPLVNQHFAMLYRNLIYTGLTRAKKLAVFVGSRRALKTAVSQQNTALRQTALQVLLLEDDNRKIR